MTKRGFIPPRVTNTKIEFTNKYMTVRADSLTFEQPQGDKIETEYYSIDCSDFVVGIAVKNDQILLVNQYRFPTKDFDLEFVAGMIDPGKTPEEAMLAEFKEEAGIIAHSVRLLGKFCPLPGQNSNKGYIFYTDDFSESENQLEEYEQLTALTKVWVPINIFSNMIRENKIKDGVTLASWALSREFSLINST